MDNWKDKIIFPHQLDEEIYYEEQCQNDGVWHKHYIIGNAKTFIGLASVYCPEDDVFLSESLKCMQKLSPKAKIWMNGFLHGAEPDYPEGDFESNHPIILRFNRLLKQYFKIGFYPD